MQPFTVLAGMWCKHLKLEWRIEEKKLTLFNDGGSDGAVC